MTRMRTMLAVLAMFCFCVPMLAQCGFVAEPVSENRWYRSSGWELPGAKSGKIIPTEVIINGKPPAWPEGMRVSVIVHRKGYHANFPAAVFETGNAIVSWLLVTVLFALLYRVLPDVEIPWRDVWVGALLTALLLSVGKWAIGFYMGRSAIALEYGAAGSMIVMLFWVYFASLLVLLGAVFTRVQARHFEAHRIQATRGAVRVETVKKELPT